MSLKDNGGVEEKKARKAAKFVLPPSEGPKP